MADTPKITTPWDNHYMLPAFLGCVDWALTEPDMVEAFRAKSGHTWKPAHTAIDAMIDRATGADLKFIQDFVDFVASDIFGTPADLEASDAA